MSKGQTVPNLNPPGLLRCMKFPPLESVLSLKILCPQKASIKIRMSWGEMRLMKAVVLIGMMKRTWALGSRFECWLSRLPLSYMTSECCLTYLNLRFLTYYREAVLHWSMLTRRQDTTLPSGRETAFCPLGPACSLTQ